MSTWKALSVREGDLRGRGDIGGDNLNEFDGDI